MTDLWEWMIVVGLTVAFNVTPVFAPPTVALLAYFQVVREMDPLTLALVGGVSATGGKVLLAYLSRPLGDRFVPESKRLSIDALVKVVKSRRSLGLSYLVIFAVGPIPKGALFAAVGLARLSPIPGAIVFGVTRTGFYYVSLLAVDTAASSLRDFLDLSVAGSLGIAVQIISFILMLLAFRLDFGKLLARFPRIEGWLRRLMERFSPAEDAE